MNSMTLPCELSPSNYIAERSGSGHLNFAKNGVHGTRKWVVPWVTPDGTDYLQQIQRLLGLTIAGPGGIPSVTYPDVWSPELPWLYCQEVDMEGEDSQGTDLYGRIKYRRAKLTAKYMPYEVGEHFSVKAQAINMPEGSFSFLGNLDLKPAPPFVANEPPELAEILKKIKENAGQKPGVTFYSQNIIDPGVITSTTTIPEFDIPPLGGVPIPPLGDTVQLGEALATQAALGGLPDAGWVKQYNEWLADTQNTLLAICSPGVTDDIFQAKKTGAISQQVIKIIPLGEYTLNRHQVLTPNFWSYIAILGCVNGFYFLGFPPWTIMFSGMDGKRTVLPNGTKTWDMTFKFHFNPNSWNHIYRPEKGRWEPVCSNGLSEQTYWTIQQAQQIQNVVDALPVNVDVVAQQKGPLHGWLYRPTDLASILLYS